MSLECAECERDLRGSHNQDCSRFVSPEDGCTCGGGDEEGLHHWSCDLSPEALQ